MAGSQPSTLQRFILWDYPRGSRQYDVVVVLILAFIFGMPRHIFRDQPRPQQVVLVPSTAGSQTFWLEPDLLANVPEPQRISQATTLVRRYNEKATVTRVDAISDPEGDVRGYMAYTKP